MWEYVTDMERGCFFLIILWYYLIGKGSFKPFFAVALYVSAWIEIADMYEDEEGETSRTLCECVD